MRNLIIGDHMEKNGVGRARGTYWREGRCIHGGEREWKRPLRISSFGWRDNIKVNF